MKNLKLFIYLILSSFLLSIFNGCFLLGHSIGSSLDEPIIRNFNVSSNEINRFEPDTPLILYLNNGDTLNGLFVKLDSISNKEYSKNYNKFLVENSDNLWFPSLNDTIGINSANKLGFIFKGFDFGSIKIKSLVSNITRNRYLENILYISNKNNNKLDTEKIKQYMKNGNLPLFSNLVIKNDIDISTISSSQIIGGELLTSNSGRVTGLLIGAAVDVLAFILLREMMSNVLR